jgi:hypothetical protein
LKFNDYPYGFGEVIKTLKNTNKSIFFRQSTLKRVC